MKRRLAVLLAGVLTSGSLAALAAPPPVEPEKGGDFWAKVDADKNVERLPSGLRIKMVRPGDGRRPAATDTVKVHYRGALTDGTEFDSSYKRDRPASFPLTGVIKCWTEGLQRMNTGAKATLYCPPELAYGADGRPPVIPPSATLVFEVELLEIAGSETPQH